MIKVTLCRSYSGKDWWKVNRKAKGAFIREFKDISELAGFLNRTKRLYLPKASEELTRDQLLSLFRKLGSLQGKFRFIPTFPNEEAMYHLR